MTMQGTKYNMSPDSRRIAMLMGQKIERLRRARNMSRADLAMIADVTERAICSWEIGQRVPHVPTLYRIAAALSVEPKALLP